MAIINSITGYYGFTLDGTEGSSPVDKKGQVDRCIISIIYPPYKNDVTVTISDGPDDWGIKMGDDSIIPLRNPKILFTNRDNCIAQFDMDTLYPSNSPCSLVYRSDTAKISMKEESSSSGDFKVNSVSGHFAFTTNSFGASTNENGEVNKLMATIPFPYQISTVRVTISNGVNEWGARMGDGSIIPLRNPEVIRTNSENAIVKFDMDNFYPSNSPCILVYLSENASIGIEEIDDDNEFHPVTNIIDVPTKAIAGEVVDLNTAKVLPWNASIQKIDWTIVSGTGVIKDNHYLVTSKQGTITIRGTIENGMEGDDATNDFVKTFNIAVSSNVITIDANPAADMKMYVGKISGEISVVARSNSDHIKYQWYKCNNRNYGSSVKLEGSTQSTFKVPTSLGKGEYFYYCELTSDGAATVKSQCCRVYVDYEITSIRIVPRTDVLPYTGTRDLNIEHSPAEADPPRIVWRSSDSDKINVDVDGNVTANLLPGTITITAETVDSKHRDTLDLTINDFVSVTDITSIMTSGDTDTNHVLTGNVVPATASYRTIIWSVADAGGTGASITNGVLRAVNPGIVKVKATIEKGLSFNTAFTKEFFIAITKKFVPVTDVTLNSIPDSILPDTIIDLSKYNVSPNNSTHNVVIWSIISAGATGSSLVDNVLSFKNTGTVKIRATIEKGSSLNSNFIKDFSLTISSDNFVPVEYIDVMDIYDTNQNPDGVNLDYTVYPIDATNKIADVSLLTDNNGSIGYDKSRNIIFVKNINAIDPVDSNQYVTFRFLINNGTKSGSFTCDLIVKISPRNANVFYPITNVRLNQPEPLRALFPVGLAQYTIAPQCASAADPEFPSKVPGENIRQNVSPNYEHGEDMSSIFMVYYNDNNPGAMNFQEIFDLPIFQWTMVGKMIYSYKPGYLTINTIIKDGSCEHPDDPYCDHLKNYTQKDELYFQDPFIAVKDIINIPTEVVAGSEYYLSPELDTKGGIDFYNPLWDNETPTYTDISMKVISGPGSFNPRDFNDISGCSGGLDNPYKNALYVDGSKSSGKIVIEMTVESGIAENINWYGLQQQKQDFTKRFEISVIKPTSAWSMDYTTNNGKFILKLTLKNGKNPKLFHIEDWSKICNDGDEDTKIMLVETYPIRDTTQGYSFKKSDVISIEFGETDKITTMKNFARNFTSLVTLVGTIPVLSGDSCYENFMRGCTSFNSPISINQNTILTKEMRGNKIFKYFMRDCTSMNSRIFINIDSIIGNHCLHGFLFGCTSFNTHLTISQSWVSAYGIPIPHNISGEGCLERFMMNCSSYTFTPLNGELRLERHNITGDYCFRDFMANCKKIDGAIKLPVGIWQYPGSLYQFIRNCNAFKSSIDIPAANNVTSKRIVNEQSFSTMFNDSPIHTVGVTFTGEGAAALKSKVMDTPIQPYRKINI